MCLVIIIVICLVAAIFALVISVAGFVLPILAIIAVVWCGYNFYQYGYELVEWYDWVGVILGSAIVIWYAYGIISYFI